MKTATLREVKEQFSQFVSESQKESVVVTRHGRPAAVVVGIEGHDLEDILYMTSASFWRTIQARRREKTAPFQRRKTRLSARHHDHRLR